MKAGASRGQKRPLDLKLESLVLVSCPIWVLGTIQEQYVLLNAKASLQHIK